MQDFCFKTTDQGTLIVALDALGLVVDGQVVGDWMWVGKVAETPGAYDPETGTETTAPIYLDGEYAVYRATDAQATVIEAASWPDGVELVDPPTGVPMFGGEWLQPDLATLQAEACARIDAAAEALRQTVLTPGSGQAIEYQRTRAEASAAIAANAAGETLTAADYPFLAAEQAALADTTGEVTLLQVAQAVQSDVAASDATLAAIKQARRAGKLAVAAAITVAGINAAEAGVAWP